MITSWRYIHVFFLALFVAVLSACDSDVDSAIDSGSTGMTIRVAPSNLLGGVASEQEAKITRLDVYHFENGMLSEFIGGLLPDQAGDYVVRPTGRKGTLYFLANASGIESLDEVRSLDDFLQAKVSGAEMTELGLLMTGKLSLEQDDSDNSANLVSMRRSVARLDIDARTEGVRVSRIKIKNVATSGFVWSGDTIGSPDGTRFEEREFLYQQPLAQASSPICYLYEQDNKELSVELYFSSGESDHRLEVALPAIRRNTVYTMKILGNGTNFTVEVETTDWDEGISSDADLEYQGLINVEASELGDSILVSANRDTLYVPYQATDFRLVLSAVSGADAVVSGQVDGGQILKESYSKSLDKTLAFRVRSDYRMPGFPSEYLRLEVMRSGSLVGRVTVVFQCNPIILEGGRISLDKTGTCDFGTYVDGDLGVLTLPEGKSLAVRFDDPDAPWVRLDRLEGSNNRYRIQGGWRPNDPDSDGRIQSAQLVVTGRDGSVTEQFTLKRRNYGLPVVNINGTWWCKYNLRGNVKDFEDQIGVGDDPVPGASGLADFLNSCPAETLLSLMGDQYQAGNPQGLRLSKDESGLFYYDGVQNSISADFGSLPATEMAPSGYQVPDYNDLRTFTWGNNSNMGYGSNWFNNNMEGDLFLRFQYFIVERQDVVWLGERYGSVIFYDFRLNGGSDGLVLFGLGHQWDATAGNVAPNSILFATYGSRGKTWQIEGYPQSDGRGNWYKFTGHNTVKTRTIRCVKTPVDYIY